MLCCLISHVRLFATTWTIALQAPLSLGFSKLEYWSGLPCPPPGDLGDSGTEPVFPVSYASLAGSLQLSHQGSPMAIKHKTLTYLLQIGFRSFCFLKKKKKKRQTVMEI